MKKHEDHSKHDLQFFSLASFLGGHWMPSALPPSFCQHHCRGHNCNGPSTATAAAQQRHGDKSGDKTSVCSWVPFSVKWSSGFFSSWNLSALSNHVLFPQKISKISVSGSSWCPTNWKQKRGSADHQSVFSLFFCLRKWVGSCAKWWLFELDCGSNMRFSKVLWLFLWWFCAPFRSIWISQPEPGVSTTSPSSHMAFSKIQVVLPCIAISRLKKH